MGAVSRCQHNRARPGGRLSFVVPAEIGHAPYAIPLIEYLARSFDDLRLVAIRQTIFPHLSQDVWLLFADGYGGRTERIALTAWDRFRAATEPPQPDKLVDLSDWRECSCRLRPFLLAGDTLQLYRHLTSRPETYRMGEVARVGTGYITGANDFFHLRPLHAEAKDVPKSFLAPAVVSGRALPKKVLNHSAVSRWMQRDEQSLLLRIQRHNELPKSIKRYLESEAAYRAKETYKCRHRSPWYVVPDVVDPDAFLTYMNGGGPSLVLNAADCVCTNSLHAVRMRDGHHVVEVQKSWQHPLVSLSAEVEGHPLGGGMLKLEPREACRLLLPKTKIRLSPKDAQRLEEGVLTLRKWRHHE